MIVAFYRNPLWLTYLSLLELLPLSIGSLLLFPTLLSIWTSSTEPYVKLTSLWCPQYLFLIFFFSYLWNYFIDHMYFGSKAIPYRWRNTFFFLDIPCWTYFVSLHLIILGYEIYIWYRYSPLILDQSALSPQLYVLFASLISHFIRKPLTSTSRCSAPSWFSWINQWKQFFLALANCFCSIHGVGYPFIRFE